MTVITKFAQRRVAVNTLVLSLVLAVALGAPKVDKSDKKLKHVIITSFGEMPYEPLEGFVQSDVIPVNFQDEEKNPTMDVALRTGILVEDPNEKKTEDNSTEEDEYSSDNDGRKSDKLTRGDRKTKTGEELFREFREKYRYAPKKDTRQYSTNQWSPMIPSIGDGEFLRPREPPAPPPKTNDEGYNIDREYHGDLGEGWNLDDAVEVLQDRKYNVLTPSPHPALPPRELPPPLLPPSRTPIYPFQIPSFPLPFPNFNPHRRSRVFPVSQEPNFFRYPQQESVNRKDIPRLQELEGIRLHPTKIGVPYKNPNELYGTDYLSGV